MELWRSMELFCKAQKLQGGEFPKALASAIQLSKIAGYIYIYIYSIYFIYEVIYTFIIAAPLPGEAWPVGPVARLGRRAAAAASQISWTFQHGEALRGSCSPHIP